MRREDCIIHCVGPDCEGCSTYRKEVIVKYKEISYRLVKNLGNYSTETIELLATVVNMIFNQELIDNEGEL
jgi:hypothetical protein